MRKNILSLSCACILLLCMISFTKTASAQNGEYRVWVKTSPCSGRFDWISVSKQDPTSPGLSFYSSASTIFPGTPCTASGCSFKEATRIANSLRPSPVFSQYCCKDYSVWQNSGTGAMSVVVGKFSTAGPGWVLVKGDLCCEEAEALSGIPGACSSGADQIKPPVKCYPGSHPEYNKQTKRTECYCNPGLIWNSTMTACIKGVQCYPGSHAAVNPATGNTECYCDEGLVWNSTKTACVKPAVQCYPGSHAEFNTQANRTECFCDPGLVWNSTRTACVKPAVQCYPGSHAEFNAQTNRTECFCDPGLVWNSTKTACVAGPVQCYPGSHAATNPQTGKTECYCDAGLVWNSAKTACVTPPVQCYPGSYAATNPQTGGTECYCNPGLVWNSTKTACVKSGGNGGATWALVAVEAHPDKPAQGWTFSQGGTAHMDVYNGDKGDFQWTPPPASFGKEGFTVTLSAQAKPGTPGATVALILGCRGRGLTTDAKSEDQYISPTSPQKPSDSKSIKWVPSGTPNEIEVEIGMMWGAVWFVYKYKKQ